MVLVSSFAGVLAYAGDAARFATGFAGDGDAGFAGVAEAAAFAFAAFFGFSLAPPDFARVGLLTIMYSATTTTKTAMPTETTGLL